MSEFDRESEIVWDGTISPSEIDETAVFSIIDQAKPWRLMFMGNQAFSATYASFNWIDGVDTVHSVTIEEHPMDFSRSTNSSREISDGFDLQSRLLSLKRLGSRAVQLAKPKRAGIVRVTRSNAWDIGTEIHYSHRHGSTGQIDFITADPASTSDPEELTSIIGNIVKITKEMPKINTPLVELTHVMRSHYGLQREIRETKKTYSSSPFIQEKRVISPPQHIWDFGNKAVSVAFRDEEFKEIYSIKVTVESEGNFHYEDYKMNFQKGCEYFSKFRAGTDDEEPRYFDHWDTANIMTIVDAEAIQSLFRES